MALIRACDLLNEQREDGQNLNTEFWYTNVMSVLSGKAELK